MYKTLLDTHSLSRGHALPGSACATAASHVTQVLPVER